MVAAESQNEGKELPHQEVLTCQRYQWVTVEDYDRIAKGKDIGRVDEDAADSWKV